MTGTLGPAPRREQMVPAPALPPLLHPAPLTLDRAQLTEYAEGHVSSVFGPLFRRLDRLPVRIRLPRDRMLVIDEATIVGALPAARGAGVIRARSRIERGVWFLDPSGRVPATRMAEILQITLPLCTYLGFDLAGGGDRTARLLDAELVFHADRPVAGDVLDSEVRLTGHAEHDGLAVVTVEGETAVGAGRRMTIRRARAAIFDKSRQFDGGLDWDASRARPSRDHPFRLPSLVSAKRAFTAEQVAACYAGHPEQCFGPEWAGTEPPRLPDGPMRMLREVAAFDPVGGPWGRGYLRAEFPITPQDWYLNDHFVGDPCMPGLLMWESGLQAMWFYLAAVGLTAGRDGWRFDIMPEHPYLSTFRGEATAANHSLTCELFITGVTGEPYPLLHGDLLFSVDGRKIAHVQDCAARLVPSDPLAGTAQFNRATMLAATVADYTRAFGPEMSGCDGRIGLRLPAPPLMMMDRVVRVTGPMHSRKAGNSVEAVLEIPPSAWYLAGPGKPAVPMVVLLESALQPCGWLTAYTLGNTLAGQPVRKIRNLDGTARFLSTADPGAGQIRTVAELTWLTEIDDTMLVSFRLQSYSGDFPLAETTTTFGLFSEQGLAAQAGLPPTRGHDLDEPSAPLARMDAHRYLLGSERLAVIDAVTGYWPGGGSRGLGRVRGERRVGPADWYFAAHFTGDPVKPGALGVEAMAHLLKVYLIERYGAQACAGGFVPAIPGAELAWKYRGQVLPSHRTLTVEIEVTETGHDAGSVYAVADGNLWADGTRFYEVRGLSMRTGNR
jgi:3-hydroxymyristoyl/3-hydroxydecanoyl-(acyl carrier protein) dehydratase